MFAISAFVNAEDVEVYLCDVRNGDVHWGERGDIKNTTFLTFYRIGKKVGVLRKDNFPAFFKKTKENDRFSDPFYTPSINYVLKDTKGNHYIAHVEHDGYKPFEGQRVRLDPLRPIGNHPNVFEGSPYKEEGTTSFDEDFLAQLNTLTKKAAEQASAGQPATAPESKSGGSDKPQPEAEGRSR
jgi:hypothetical protein